MREYLKLLILLPLTLTISARGQSIAKSGPINNTISNKGDKSVYVDSLTNQFRNSVFRVLNDPHYWHNFLTETFTFIKVDIDNIGMVQNISFSDSADSSFVNEYSRRLNFDDLKPTLSEYAKAMSYKSLSLLLPITYIPQQRGKRAIDPDALNRVMMFNKKEFSGKAVLLQPVRMTVMAWGNM